MTEIELLTEINNNLRNLLCLTATETLPDDRKFVFLRNMKFTSAEISKITGIPERTIRNKWNDKPTEGSDGRNK